jgi:hypothetical protein
MSRVYKKRYPLARYALTKRTESVDKKLLSLILVSSNRYMEWIYCHLCVCGGVCGQWQFRVVEENQTAADSLMNFNFSDFLDAFNEFSEFT